MSLPYGRTGEECEAMSKATATEHTDNNGTDMA